MSKVAIKSRSKSLIERISAKLTAMQPENPAHGTFEHARSTEISPTFIRYLVTTGIRAFDDRVGGMPVGKAIELCGLPKSGKCHGKGTRILMHDGSIKLVEDVRVGDRLMGDDSTPRTVLSLAHGTDQLYKVVPKMHGDAFVVNGAHIMVLQASPCQRWKRREVVEISLNDYLSGDTQTREKLKLLRTGVVFPEQPVSLDPYFLGLWLGDGNEDRPAITTADPEILVYLESVAERYGLAINPQAQEGNASTTYYLTNARGAGNALLEELRSLRVLDNKHIPDSYLFNSQDVRRKVLAGLLDADGHLTERRHYYEITQKRPILAEQIVYLARSLGYAVSVKPKSGTIQGRIVGQYWRITIHTPNDLPLRLPRKQNSLIRQKAVNTSGFRVQEIGIGEYFGFTLTGNGRYLLADFTVTHNTNMAVRVCVRAQQGFIYERIQLEDGCIELKQLEPNTFNVTTIYYDNEGSLSDFYHRQVDGTVMDGEIVQCETVELLWRTMDGIMEEIDKEEESTGIIQFLIVIVDTVGSMTTKLELEAAWGKQDFPRVPYQIKAGFKAMTSRMQRENVMLIGLNHVTRKMTAANRGHVAYKGWLYDSPGGLAFSYFATVQIYFEMLQLKYCLAGKGEADGLLVYFMTQKNRMMPPLRQGRMALLFGMREKDTQRIIKEGGFKDDWSVLETLIFSKAARVSKEGMAITFRFERYGLEFGPKKAQAPSLEEQEETAPPTPTPPRRGSRRPEPVTRQKDPRIASRLKWPEFYAEHRADLDALYNLVTERCLAGSESFQLPDGDDDENDEEERED